MGIEDWKNLGAAVQAFVTALSLVIGGLWAYRRYVRNEERYPNIEFSADVNFIGKQNDWWIVELIAIIQNKGKVQHRMSEFRFDLNALYSSDSVEISKQWGNQVDFRRPIAEGSLLPPRWSFFFVDPGVTAKYSYVARIPDEATFLILHCRFKYSDLRKLGHTAEETVRVPAGDAAPEDVPQRVSP